MAAGWLTPETPPPLPPNLFLAITVSQAPIHNPHARRTCARKQDQENARVRRKRRGEKGAVNSNLRWWNRKVFQAHTCVQKYTHSHTHTLSHTHTHNHTHLNKRTHTCTHTHAHAHTHQHPPRGNRRFKRRPAPVRFHTHARKVTHTLTHTRAPGSPVQEVSMSAASEGHPHIHTSTSTHMHAHAHARIHAYTHTCIHTYTRIC